MKISTSLVLFGTLAIAVASCTSKKTSTVKATDIYGIGVIQYPVVVDLDVKQEKVSGEIAWKGGGATLDNLKEMAMTDAIKKSNSDVLVDPRYDIVIKGRKKNVSVSGYPASYTNFRNAVASDTLISKIGAVQKLDAYEPMPEAGKGKRVLKTIAAVGGSVLGVILLVTLIFT